MLPKTSVYVKSYDGETKCMQFSIKGDKLFKKHIEIWNKVSNNIEKEFDSELIYNNKYLKTEIKSYGDEATDFYDNEMPKVACSYTCLAVITIDFVLKKR